MRARAGLLGALCAAYSLPASADIIHLNTGYSQECVIVRETDTHIYYMLPEGQAGLPRQKVAGVTYETEEQNDSLTKRWQAERAAEEAQRRAQERRKMVERLEKEALGLVEYEGEWIPSDEAVERAQRKRAAKKAAVELDKLETDQGHTFYNHIWMTPATYAKVREHENKLLDFQAELESRQNEIAMVENQVVVLQRQMIESAGLDGAQEISERIDALRTNQEAAREEVRTIVVAGDERADKIVELEDHERQRLRDILTAKNWPLQTMEFLGNSL